MQFRPVVLEGPSLRLEPLDMTHSAKLWGIAPLPTFRYWVTLVPHGESLEEFEAFIQETLQTLRCISLVAIHQESGSVVGKSSFMDIRDEAKGLEIGMTFIAEACRGTSVNPEMKFLMLKHAFEDQGAIRVQLKTDARNAHSRAAILKLGATFEGILRRHGIQIDGTIRDTAMYSITDGEWPTVKANLIARLRSLGVHAES